MVILGASWYSIKSVILSIKLLNHKKHLNANPSSEILCDHILFFISFICVNNRKYNVIIKIFFAMLINAFESTSLNAAVGKSDLNLHSTDLSNL